MESVKDFRFVYTVEGLGLTKRFMDESNSAHRFLRFCIETN